MRWIAEAAAGSRALVAALVVALAVAGAGAAQAQLYQGPMASELSPQFYAWLRQHSDAFFAAYMTPDGRVFDPENGGITHSESQAYGMAIAYDANDAETFDRIWTWTRDTLRNADGLHAWRYEPGRGVVDRNNATDADLIIAAMLSLAAKRWNRGDYLRAAVQTASTLGEAVLLRHEGVVVMLPGRSGFTRPSQPDGPVVNLSYYHFDVMRIVADLDPSHPWDEAISAGLDFYERVVDAWTPSDWTSVADPQSPVPAERFPRRASYDAVRGPINLLAIPWDRQGELLRIVDRRFASHGAVPGIYDPHRGVRTADLAGTGYELIAAAVHCAATGTQVPMRFFAFRPETYFSSALQLLVIHQLYTKYPRCIPI